MSVRCTTTTREASFPNVGLSKSVGTKVQRHFQSGQYLIRRRDDSPPITPLEIEVFRIWVLHPKFQRYLILLPNIWKCLNFTP